MKYANNYYQKAVLSTPKREIIIDGYKATKMKNITRAIKYGATAMCLGYVVMCLFAWGLV